MIFGWIENFLFDNCPVKRALNDANNRKRLAVPLQVLHNNGKSEFCEKSLKQVQ